MIENEISKNVLDAAITVHQTIGGPVLLESFYETALAYELKQRGMHVNTQKLFHFFTKAWKLVFHIGSTCL